MEVMRTVLLLFVFVGVFISGGIFFNSRIKGKIYLSLFLLLLCLDQLNYLYESSQVLQLDASYFLYFYTACLLFGPLLWWYFLSLDQEHFVFKKKQLLHLLPFLSVTAIFVVPLLLKTGANRLAFATAHFDSYLMPINYVRTIHVCIYGVYILLLLFKSKAYQKNDRGLYLTIITFVFMCAAVSQSLLTAFARNYGQFVYYYILIDVIVMIVGIALFRYPQVLSVVIKKYFKSSLTPSDRTRIEEKLQVLTREQPSFFIQKRLTLSTLSMEIGEQKHHISEVLSKDMDTSFVDYINVVKIDKAKRLLADASYAKEKLLRIATECGFNNTVTFNKAFVKKTGVSPGKYRKDLLRAIT